MAVWVWARLQGKEEAAVYEKKRMTKEKSCVYVVGGD